MGEGKRRGEEEKLVEEAEVSNRFSSSPYKNHIQVIFSGSFSRVRHGMESGPPPGKKPPSQKEGKSNGAKKSIGQQKTRYGKSMRI